MDRQGLDSIVLLRPIRRAQLENRRSRLQLELDNRNTLPEGDPRRIGGPENVDNYPVLFEFDGSNLPADSRGIPEGRPLGGESSVYGTVDLGERLVRVYAPEANIAEVQQELSAIFGHSDFEVLPLEAMEGLATTGAAAQTAAATEAHLTMLERLFSEAIRYYGEL